MDGYDVILTDSTEDYAVLGLMGPQAARIVAQTGAPELNDLGYFKVGPAHIADKHVRAARMSYVGEAGFEITCKAENAPPIYAALTAAGAVPAGLYAQSSMRIEKGFAAMGHELDSDVSPKAVGMATRTRLPWSRNRWRTLRSPIMCGTGRTGHLLASDTDAVASDILCTTRGLGAGCQRIGAMLCTKGICDTIAGSSGWVQHGHTYLGHPVATAAGLAVVQKILGQGLVARSAQKGAKLSAALHSAFSQYPYVGDIRGRGLFQGIELVVDRETKTPFDPGLKIAAKIKSAAFEAGLICYPMPGTRDGRVGDHVLLAPPLYYRRRASG